jgi:hypothetical protein
MKNMQNSDFNSLSTNFLIKILIFKKFHPENNLITLFFNNLGSQKTFQWYRKDYIYIPISFIIDDLNGSVGSIADLTPKGPGFESQISHGFPSCKEVEDIGLTNRPRKRSKYV